MLSFLVISSISITVIFALTQQNVTTEVDVEYYPSVLLESFSFLENSDGTVTISSFDEKNYEGSLVVPKTYNGKPVTSIGDSAFSECTGLTSVEIPDSVTYIGGWAFFGCVLLNTVELPNGIKSIKVHTFHGCTKLTNLTIPSSLISIESYAFLSSGITSVIIPDSVTSIGVEAFRYCYDLTSVTFNNTNGWFVSKDSTATSGTDLSSSDLANTSTAVTYLRSTYYDYYWKRAN